MEMLSGQDFGGSQDGATITGGKSLVCSEEKRSGFAGAGLTLD